MGAASDIDRLVELGLNRYGAGDLDGAILMWEEALAIDPDNAQATSYLDYAKTNYDLIANAVPSVARADESPFAIVEEPEYQIDVEPGDLTSSDPMQSSGVVDGGWFDDAAQLEDMSHPIEQLLDDELTLRPTAAPTIEAREPEPDVDLGPEISFEDATREHLSAAKLGLPMPPRRPGSELPDSPAAEFQQEETTGGFRSQQTEVRKRDLGFVQPVTARTDSAEDLVPTNPGIRRSPSASQPPPSQADIETQDLPVLRDKVNTRDYPEPRPPARRDSTDLSQAEMMLSHAKTRKFNGDIDIGAPTRDLGLRPPAPVLSNPDDEDMPTKQSDARAIREGVGTKHDLVLPFDPIDARAEQILTEIDANAPAGEAKDDRTRRRITTLVERAVAWNAAGDIDRAVAAVDLAIAEDPNSALAQKLITRNRDAIMAVFQGFVGDVERMPQLAKPLHELQNAPINPRAAFLLSRIDGTLTVDELLDVSGMPRMEAYRYLCQLLLRGILR